MIVKNIRIFRKWLKHETDNDNKDENFIGFSHPYGTDGKNTTKARGFFNVYHNQAKNIDDRLSTVLDMAQDSQAIYEFVQNAVDCDSTACFMFYHDNHFVAINNGSQFDLEGIRSILNFAQSTKTRDENIGKFGVGFKLIHRMVGAGNGLQELTQDYTGPILFSWSNKDQLSDLLNANSITDIKTESNEDWDNSNSSWFFKILLTCVPILPNNIDTQLRDVHYEIRDDLFTEEEFKKFKIFLNDIWRNNQDKFLNENLNHGSLFYLRLGSDKEEKLDEDYSYFKKGIQYSLSFVANLMNKKGLKKIYFNNEEPIEKGNVDVCLEDPFIIKPNSDEFEEIKSKLKENDKTRNINLVFGYQKFENTCKYAELRESPNFFKFFPMGKEVCGLNFIVHSNIFEIEASRREFVQSDKRNIFIIEKLSQKLQNRLDEYKKSDPEKFDNIFLSILFSNEPGPQQQWITTALYKPLLNYITENCLIDKSGHYKPAAMVVIKNTQLSVQPSDFGIANRFWFKWKKKDFENIKTPEGKKDTSYEKLIKQWWCVSELIKEGNLNFIKEWYSTIDEETKEIFHTELIENWNNVTETKFWDKVVEIPELINQVIESNQHFVKDHYIKNLISVTLHTNTEYTINDYEFKVLNIAHEILRPNDTTDIEEFRNKVFILDNNNTHKLFDVRENDKIIFKNSSGGEWQLNLSGVLPSYESKSGLLNQIIINFEKLDLKLHKLFGIGRQKPFDEIYNLLLQNYQKLENGDQFAFLGFYSVEKNTDYFGYFDFEKLQVSDVLDIYFNNPKYPFPKKYAEYIDNFTPEHSVYPDEWAIREERLPISIKKWIEKNETENKLKFLSDKSIGINDEESTTVIIRKVFSGQFEVTHDQITLAIEKTNPLLLNTMKWLQLKDIIIKEEHQIQTIKKLLNTYYYENDYDKEHPQLYVQMVCDEDISEYKFLPNKEKSFYIDISKITEMEKYGVMLKQIFEVAHKNDRPIFDFRNYPESKLSKADWSEIIIIEIPDFNTIHNNSWSFDLPFFTKWEDSIKDKVLFYNGVMPKLIQFENEILRRYNNGDHCKNGATGTIYINIDPALDNATKARQIVEYITNCLPEEYFQFDEKTNLKNAYSKWKEGENPDVTKIRKKHLKDAEEYSFGWLKALFDWEYDKTFTSHKDYTIFFEKVEFRNECIILGECSLETIPSRVEFHPDPIELYIKRKNEIRIIVCNITNYNEFEVTLQPISQTDVDYFKNFQYFDGYRANFKLHGEDALMKSLKNNLFGANGIAPKDGSMTEYFEKNFSDNKISFLFGPPGTGKTTKIALDILLTLAHNKSIGINTKILILAPTNKAADVGLEKILELLSDDQMLREVALTYYSEESVKILISYSTKIFVSNEYQNIFVRYGNSVSSKLIEHQILKTKYTLKQILANLVLVTTVHRLSFDELAGNKLKDLAIGWTHIVIDEASMVSLPHTVFTLLQFRSLSDVATKVGLLSTFTISGDPFQIQPVGQTPNYIEQGKEKYKGWGTENIYTLFGLTNISPNRTPIGNFYINKLLTQYRSVPAVGELFSKYKYYGRIKHKKDKNIRETKLGKSFLENINLIYFPVFGDETPNAEDIFKIQKYGEFSAYHIYSIVFSCELATAVKLQNPNKTVSIITPYSTQARLTKEISYAFRNQNIENHFNVSTIHSCQGDENDVVILVMNPPNMEPYEYSHFNNSYLINVGISRAKETLIFLHPENITGHSEINNVVLPLIKNLNVMHCDDVESIIFDYHDNSKKIKDLVKINGFQIFNVCDLKEFTKSNKEYLFFADTRELKKGEKRYANVIVNISKRFANANHIQPQIDLLVQGTITGIHKNNKTAFVDIENINANAVIHINSISNNYLTDINHVLKIDQKIKAKILKINDKGIILTMKEINQDK